MVRSANHGDVDVVARQHFPVVQILLAAGSKFLFRRQASRLGNIADRYNLCILRFGRQTQQVGRASAHAETSDANALVCAEDTAIGGVRRRQMISSSA
jgi:hypothetical protein